MTVGITVRDGVAYLETGGHAELWEKIVEATSFQLEGIEYGRRRGGDLRTKLVRNNKCPMGLLDRVCRTVQHEGGEVRVEYADSWQAPKPDIDIHLYGGVDRRDYQQEAELAAILNDRGVIRAPTGSGKTIIGGLIAASKGKHALIIVPTIDLLHQYRDWLSEHMWVSDTFHTNKPRYPIGQLGDGRVDPQPVTVATIRTIAKVLEVAYEPYGFGEYDDKDETAVNPRALRQWVQEIGTVIVDEAHILGARVVYDVTTKIPAPYKYGMSASPWRDDGADLMIEAATGPLIYRVEAERLVRQRYLLAPEIVVYDTSGWWNAAAWGTVCRRCKRQHLRRSRECSCGSREFRSQFDEAYKQEIVDNDERNGRIAQIVRDLDRPTMVLVKQVRHGRQLAAMLPQAVFLSGRRTGEDRRQAFDQMRAGQAQTLVCTTIGDMGLDLPELGALVLAGGGKSSTRHLQRIGRVVRPAPGKPTPLVIDFNDGHVHSWFANHARLRRRIEEAEWHGLASWRYE